MITRNTCGQVSLPLGGERAQKEPWGVVVWDPVGQKTSLPTARAWGPDYPGSKVLSPCQARAGHWAGPWLFPTAGPQAVGNDPALGVMKRTEGPQEDVSAEQGGRGGLVQPWRTSRTQSRRS